MDILDILLDILLKPPQPFIGLFLNIFSEYAKADRNRSDAGSKCDKHGTRQG